MAQLLGRTRRGIANRRRTGLLLGVAAILAAGSVWAFGLAGNGGTARRPPVSDDQINTTTRPDPLVTNSQPLSADGGGEGKEEPPGPVDQSDCGFTGLYRACQCEWTTGDDPAWCREIDCGPRPNGLIGTTSGDASGDCIVIVTENQVVAVDSPCNPEHILYPRVIKAEPSWVVLCEDGGANCRCALLDVSVTRTTTLSHSRETRDQAPMGIGKLPVDSPFSEVEISEPYNVEWVTERIETITVTESTEIVPCRMWCHKKYKQRVDICRDTREGKTLYACSANGCYSVALECLTDRVSEESTEWIEGGFYPDDGGFMQYANCPGGRSCSDGEDGACDTP